MKSKAQAIADKVGLEPQFASRLVKQGLSEVDDIALAALTEEAVTKDLLDPMKAD